MRKQSVFLARCLAALSFCVAAPALAQTAEKERAPDALSRPDAAKKIAAPNVVEITPQLTTSGQPTAAALAQLGQQGFGAVIYLAPPTVSDAIADEPAILAAQGITYTNIPIEFYKPSAEHFEAFVAALAASNGKKVLVHCQVNMRASSMIFLHRVIIGKEDPQTAYEMVSRVWSPNRTWKRFINEMLQKNHIPFEAF